MSTRESRLDGSFEGNTTVGGAWFLLRDDDGCWLHVGVVLSTKKAVVIITFVS